MLLLGVDQTQEILSVGVVGIERSDFLEISDGGVGVASGFFHQAEVEPGPGIARVALRRFLQDFAGFVEALHIEKSDTGIKAADVGLRVENAGALEFAQGFFELLAIHEGDAEIVFADYVGAGIRRWLLGGGVVVGFCRGGAWVGAFVMLRRRGLSLRGLLRLLLLAGCD